MRQWTDWQIYKKSDIIWNYLEPSFGPNPKLVDLIHISAKLELIMSISLQLEAIRAHYVVFGLERTILLSKMYYVFQKGPYFWSKCTMWSRKCHTSTTLWVRLRQHSYSNKQPAKFRLHKYPCTLFIQSQMLTNRGELQKYSWIKERWIVNCIWGIIDMHTTCK